MNRKTLISNKEHFQSKHFLLQRKEDKDKTPTSVDANELKHQQSTISRLESKYSDVLDRFARRRRRQDASDIVGVDRDKTLEPRDNYENGDDEENGGYHPLSKSATTSNLGLFKNSRLKNSGSFGNADRKERTPFRLTRNKTSRYLVDSDGRDNNGHYRTRYYEPGGSGRYREHAPDLSSRYTRNDKENYKSRYDPEALSTDLSSSTRRQRTYGRTKTLTDLLNGDDTSGASTSYPSTSTSSTSRPNRFDANNRKSLGTALQRSRTNAYLYEADPNNIQFDDEDRSSADNAAILAALREDNNETAANAFSERIEKRKTVKNMLIKYAEDDSYDINNKNDDAVSVAASNTSSSSSANSRSKKKDSVGTTIPSTSTSSYKRVDGVGPLFYDPPMSSYRKPLTSKPSNVYDNSVINSRFLPLTKSATSSSLSLLGNRQPQTSSYLYQQRSRIPKTLSSFVRHFYVSFFYV